MTQPEIRPTTAYLNIHGTGRPNSVARTLQVSPAIQVDLLPDGWIAGIECLAGPVDATALLIVLHHVALVTPEVTAVLDAARWECQIERERRIAVEDGLVEEWTQERDRIRERRRAAVDALEARRTDPTGAGT
jgi:hypothetical protein